MIFCPYATSHLSFKSVWVMAFQRGVDCTGSHLSYNWLGTRSHRQSAALFSTMSHHTGVGRKLTLVPVARQKKTKDGSDNRSQLHGLRLTNKRSLACWNTETHTQIWIHTHTHTHWNISAHSQSQHSVHTCYCYSPSLCKHQIWMVYSSCSPCVHGQACQRVCVCVWGD